MSQRVPSKRSRAANVSIENKAKELEMMGYRPSQAVAIALRMWRDDELIVIEPTDTTLEYKNLENKLNVAKTIGILAAFHKSRQKQLAREREKTETRSERLKRYDDDPDDF